MPEQGIDHEQALTFIVNEQWFGIPISSVKDVMHTPPLTPVPLANNTVAGLLNLRGRIVTAFYAASFFDLSPSPLSEKKPLNTPKNSQKNMCIVFQDREEGLFSFIVDMVCDIERIPLNSLENFSSELNSTWKQFTDGTHQSQDRLLVVLNHKKILNYLEKS